MRIALCGAVALVSALSACADMSNMSVDSQLPGTFSNMTVNPPPGPGAPGQPPPPPPTLLTAHAPAPAPGSPPATTAESTLGKTLFFDKALSKDGTVSCASCHDPAKGFANGLPVGVGIGGAHGKRNVPTILNAARQPFQFWDGRAATLEQQALGPIQAVDEMGFTLPAMEQRLQAMPAYAQQFRAVYGSTVSSTLVARAIATYERTQVTGNDQFSTTVLRGDAVALAKLTPSQRSGQNLFHGVGCVACHGGPDARDDRFHDIGIGTDKASPDVGRFGVTNQATDWAAFKTPSLLNVADTGPYMHDGSLATLRDVVEHYNKGGIPNKNLDQRIRPLRLTEQQKQDLTAFLGTLHGPAPVVAAQ